MGSVFNSPKVIHTCVELTIIAEITWSAHAHVIGCSEWPAGAAIRARVAATVVDASVAMDTFITKIVVHLTSDGINWTTHALHFCVFIVRIL